jgi:hypothetical protein
VEYSGGSAIAMPFCISLRRVRKFACGYAFHENHLSLGKPDYEESSSCELLLVAVTYGGGGALYLAGIFFCRHPQQEKGVPAFESASARRIRFCFRGMPLVSSCGCLSSVSRPLPTQTVRLPGRTG